MDHSRLVRFLQAFADFDSVLQHLVRGQRTSHETIGQGFAFEELHDQVVDPVLMADVKERADVGMVQ